MHLGEIFDTIKAQLATDAKCAAVPFIRQVAEDTDEQAKVRAYNSEIEKAFNDPGIAFVCVASEAQLAGPSTGCLDLVNTVMLSVLENPKKNKTGETAFGYVRRAMRVVHQTRTKSQGRRVDIDLDRVPYNLGPLDKGLVTYFVNLSVRTTEDLGALDPA